MKGFKKPKPFYVKRLSQTQTESAITRYADANRSDPFAARRAASRIKHGLFDITEGVAHVY